MCNEEYASSSSSSSSSYAELLLPNGDFYTGQCSAAAIPHGAGKYLRTDGSMYAGELRRGAANGRGKFSWPSGATYEGEFKAGFFEGQGSFIGSFGDYYDGEWRSGLPEGRGRYLWMNGNEYSGQWKGGVIDGKGSFIWAGGNRYDGGWEGGRPVGPGRFRWADGSLYIGLWNEASEEEQEGLYYPSRNAEACCRRNPREFFAAALRECEIRAAEIAPVVPSQKVLCFLVDCGTAAGGRKKGDGRKHGGEWNSDEVGEGRKSSSSSSSRNQLLLRLSPVPERKQGVAISKGHRNYELMLNLQLGIR